MRSEDGAFFQGNPRPTFTLVNGPNGMTVDSQTGVLICTPAIDQVGLQSVTLQASNEFGTTVATFDIDTLDLPLDVHAPTAPTNLRQTGGDVDAIAFSWDAATYRAPVLSHTATNANEFVYAIVGDGLYVGDSSQSFTPAP